MEGGQVFEFGGMCRGLMDRSAFSLSAQQMQSTGQTVAYALCEVCNLQLTSDAQAQLHYNGKSHLRRLRQLQAGETGPQAPAGSHSLLQETRHSSQNATLTPAPGHHPCFSTTSSLTTGSGCSSAGRPLPALNTSTSVTMKQFLSFPIEAMSPVGLFSNFNMMDPVQKAVINHTFGVTLLPTRKQIISCSVCQLRFNSDSQAEAHYKGSRHAKKLKSQENKTKAKLSVTGESCGSSSSAAVPPVSVIDNSCQHTELSCSLADSSSHLKTLAPHLYSPSPLSSRAGSEPPPSSPPSALPAPAPVTSSLSPPPPPPPPPSSHVSSQDATLPVESEEEKAKKLLYCSLCKVAVNSLSQLEAHNAGSKHKTMLEARSGAGPIKAYPRPGAKLKNGSTSSIKGSGLQNKTFHCQICNVHVNSEIQLKQHISSRRHKDRVAGKPSKPKYSPYNKQQRSSVTKELVKPPLTPSFISTPFTPAPSSLTPTISVHSSSLSSSTPLLSNPSPLTAAMPHHPRPAAPSTLFAASFLRPAPGPIRTNQGSILFAPY
ncbi:zinc finger protein 385B isoform X3 [Takifugu rubripes]|uniref:C2H2-type domain-containing protein n=2 Tax=Takifugu rubripes TaxID=31033 RepID=H2UJA8_TAKRU|nr:zinc finger protein 385B isoform X3 [Takifugu rubripes]